MTRHVCDCGCVPGHSDPRDCAANRQDTARYMASIAQAGFRAMDAREEKCRDVHHTHLHPVAGCPFCPLGSEWKREPGGEWVFDSGRTSGMTMRGE
jgi:hypothetical protein